MTERQKNDGRNHVMRKQDEEIALKQRLFLIPKYFLTEKTF